MKGMEGYGRVQVMKGMGGDVKERDKDGARVQKEPCDKFVCTTTS